MKNILLLALAISFIGGCASNQVKREAFGAKKQYAVISIIGSKDITDVKGGQGQGSSLIGMVSAAASKNVNFSEDASKMFTITRKLTDEEFSKAKSFKFVPSKVLLKSKAYKAAKGAEPKVGIFTIGLAPGYKYFNAENKAEIQKIIKSNRLDGAIVLNTNFNYGTGGVNVGGIVSVGSTKAIVTMNVSAIDKNMNEVWRQAIKRKSEDGVANVGGAPNFKKLYPLLEQTTREALAEAVETLDATVYAKK